MIPCSPASIFALVSKTLCSSFIYCCNIIHLSLAHSTVAFEARASQRDCNPNSRFSVLVFSNCVDASISCKDLCKERRWCLALQGIRFRLEPVVVHGTQTRQSWRHYCTTYGTTVPIVFVYDPFSPRFIFWLKFYATGNLSRCISF